MDVPKNGYHKMLRGKASELFYKGEIPGFVHLSLGQEAVPTGTCANLTDQDHITSTHRGHGDIIAKGADVNACLQSSMEENRVLQRIWWFYAYC